jgi:hypothetical protein
LVNIIHEEIIDIFILKYKTFLQNKSNTQSNKPIIKFQIPSSSYLIKTYNKLYIDIDTDFSFILHMLHMKAKSWDMKTDFETMWREQVN